MNTYNSEETYYINSKDPNASLQICCHFSRLLRESLPHASVPVFLCIGSDRVTGDSLGPIVGSELQKTLKKDIPVYGTLEMPIHALNLEESLLFIEEQHPDNLLIAIDASLGTKEHQGYITLGKGSIHPGAGVDKELDAVGDIFITGIVGVSSRLSHLTLQTTRLSSVIAVAEEISSGILKSFGYPFVSKPELPTRPRSAPIALAGASLEASR